MREHVGAFRDFLKANGKTVEEQELVAAKLMGRWRKTGAPLVLCPDKDDRELGFDNKRNNNFDYEKMDPHGYACPVGSHIRRMNVRDKQVSRIMNRRLIIRRGGTYGPYFRKMHLMTEPIVALLCLQVVPTLQDNLNF